MRSVPAPAILAAALVGLALLAGAAVRAEARGGGAARGARDLDEVAHRVGPLQQRIEGLAGSTAPRGFEEAAERFGALVGDARSLGAPPELFARLIALGAVLRDRLEGARLHLEEEAGEDERALERLYRSEGWQRLGYAEVLARYWDGWAQVSRGEALAPGSERREVLESALGAFSRAAVELALPRVALQSRLGMAVALRELGRHDRARQILDGLDANLDPETDSATHAAVRYELAVLDLEAGRIESAQGRLADLPPEALDASRRQALVQMETRAWLERAERGEDSERAAREAAGRLRELYAAGGERRRFAAAQLLAHRARLRPFDTGPLGDLLRAEAAFSEQRFAEARDAYGGALAREGELVGVDLDVARYRYAVCLSRSSGGAEDALRVLDRLLAEGGGGRVRARAAGLWYALAEEEARAAPGVGAEERALRAAKLLLEVDPDAVAADHARYRAARSPVAGSRVADRLQLLDGIRPDASTYPAATIERIRLRAQGIESRGASRPSATETARAEARRLLDDLAVARRLAEAGRLPPDPERDRRLAVLRARVTSWVGAPSEAVLDAVSAARAQSSLGEGERRTLLRLELTALRATGRVDEIAAGFDAATDAEVRSAWAVWSEAFRALRAAPGLAGGTRLRMAERLASLAPARHRPDAILAVAEMLLAEGRAQEAVRRVRPLVEADPTWANARFVLARALDAGSDPRAAREAWAEVASGLEPATARRLEAELGVVGALRRAGEPHAACQRLGEIGAPARRAARAELRERYEAERARCDR